MIKDMGICAVLFSYILSTLSVLPPHPPPMVRVYSIVNLHCGMVKIYIDIWNI